MTDAIGGSRLAAVVLLASALLLLPGLGRTGLWAPDEPRYAQVAEEIRALPHGWRSVVVLHLNGAPYDQKPPFYFWLAAAAGAPGGRVSERAARLPSAVSGVLGVGLVLGFGATLFGVRTGALAALFVLTTFQLAHLARRVQLDPMLALLETAALYAFWRADREPAARARWLRFMHVALGLALLTKGPVGFLVPMLVVVSFLGVERRLRELPALFAPRHLALSLLPALVWLCALIALTPGGFFDRAIVDNLFGRFARGTAHPRPWHYFLWNFPLLALPWTVLWPAIARAARREVFANGADVERARAWRFLLAWALASLAFFSLSSGKRALYLLPALPATSLLAADVVVRALERGQDWPRIAARALACVAALLGLAGTTLVFAGPWLPVPLPRCFGAALLVVVGAAVLAWRRAGGVAPAQTAGQRLAITIGATLALEAAIFGLLFPALDDEKSPRTLGAAAARVTTPDQRVGLLGNRGLIGGIAYYAGRRVHAIETPDEAARFLSEGGRALVLRERDLPRIPGASALQVLERARRGRRAMLVVTPVDRGARGPSERPTPGPGDVPLGP